MAGYNQILGDFWNDDYVLDQLDGVQRFVYNLLLTGPFVNSAGIYKITETQISMYVGAERNIVREALQKLITDGKISYDGQALWVKNYHKYNKWTLSPRLVDFAKSNLNKIPDGNTKSEFIEHFSAELGFKTIEKTQNNNKFGNLVQVTYSVENTDNIKVSDTVSENIVDCVENKDTLSQISENSHENADTLSTQLNNYITKQINMDLTENNPKETNLFEDKNICDSPKSEPRQHDISSSEPKNAKSKGKMEQDVSNSGKRTKKEDDIKTPDMPEYWTVFKNKAELAETFYKVSGIAPLKAEFGRWQVDLDKYIEAGVTVEAMTLAIRKIQTEGKITIKAPGSVFSTARSIMANQRAPSKQIVMTETPSTNVTKKKSFVEIAAERQKQRVCSTEIARLT